MSDATTKKHFQFSLKGMAAVALIIWLIWLAGEIDLIDDVTQPPDERAEVVFLMLALEPSPRDPPVSITVTVEGQTVINRELVRVDPWQRQLTIPRGAEVHFISTQEQDGEMVCTIHKPKSLSPVEIKKRKTAGSLSCWYGRGLR